MSSFCRCLVTGGPVLATEWAQSCEAMCQSLLLQLPTTEDTPVPTEDGAEGLGCLSLCVFVLCGVLV